MAVWFLLGGLIAAVLFAVLQRQRFLHRLGQIEAMVRAIDAGTKPDPFAVHGAPRFAPLAQILARVGREHQMLKHDILEQRFNLHAILASMVEGVVVVDASQVIRSMNDSFRAMFSLGTDPVGQTVVRATRQAALSDLIRAAAAGETVEAQEIAVAPPGSHIEERFLSVNAIPMRDEAGAVTGVVAVLHDVSRLRQLEDVRRQFVANVSHELRTPLSIFHGYLETLLEMPTLSRAQVKTYLQIMRKHSHRLEALLDDLLILARLESRTDALDLEPVALEPFLRNIMREWAPKLQDRKPVIDVEPGLDTMEADPFRMEQVIGNLLENAIKYSPPGAEIAFRARTVEDRLELRVTDNGIGIPPADLPRVFERFYRVDKARGRDAGGTGLGLSIVKHIIGLHGGEVHAESTFGSGTSIVIRLPMRRPEGGVEVDAPPVR